MKMCICKLSSFKINILYNTINQLTQYLKVLPELKEEYKDTKCKCYLFICVTINRILY